jgi:uncharacterized protein YcbX
MRVGTLVGLWRYPVKSMAGEALTTAEVGWHGVAGDRRWAFIGPGLERSGFPWLTLRESASMRGFVPRFTDPEHPNTSLAVVRSPDGNEYEVTDPALAARLGDGVRVIKQDVGVFDSMPLSLISTRTLSGIEEMTGRSLEPQRFRPNLLVEPMGEGSFPEDSWLGHTVRVGGMRMRIDCRDSRCVIVTMDPETGERDQAILRQIAKRRDSCAGVYGSVVTPGTVALGDDVVLEGEGV